MVKYFQSSFMSYGNNCIFTFTDHCDIPYFFSNTLEKNAFLCPFDNCPYQVAVVYDFEKRIIRRGMPHILLNLNHILCMIERKKSNSWKSVIDKIWSIGVTVDPLWLWKLLAYIQYPLLALSIILWYFHHRNDLRTYRTNESLNRPCK